MNLIYLLPLFAILLDDPHYQSAEKLARKQTMKSIRTNKFDPNNKEKT